MRTIPPLLIPALLSIGFLWLWPHLLSSDAQGIHAGFRAVWGDFAAHLTFAQRFARFPPDLWFDHHPLFYGVGFDYPFLTGLISGALLSLTEREVAAMLIPTMTAAAVLPWIIFAFLRACGVLPTWAALGTLIFYLAGGLGWTVALDNGLVIPPNTEASMVQETAFRFGRLVHLLLPQRALQLGLPLGLLVVIGLARLLGRPADIRAGAWWREWLPQILLGGAAGLLYAVHVHSLMAVAVASAVMIGLAIVSAHMNAFRRSRMVLDWTPVRLAPFAVTATLMSIGLFLAFGGGEIREGFFRFDPGWLASDLKGWFWLWWSNAGVFYLAAAYTLFTRRLWRSRLAGSCAVAGWVLFAIVNLVRVQPWDWDNTKLEIWSFTLLLPGFLLLLQSWWQMAGVGSAHLSMLTRSAALVVILSLIPTGLLDLKQVLSFRVHSSLMWSAEQRALAKAFGELASPGDLILTVDRPHDWVSGLAGGQILLGFPGWLWSYGIETRARQAEVRTMFQGGPSALGLLDHYQVAWVVLDDEARRRYSANDDFFAGRFSIALQQGDTTIYALRRGPDRDLPGSLRPGREAIEQPGTPRDEAGDAGRQGQHQQEP